MEILKCKYVLYFDEVVKVVIEVRKKKRFFYVIWNVLILFLYTVVKCVYR